MGDSQAQAVGGGGGGTASGELDRPATPFEAQDVQEVAELFRRLEAAVKVKDRSKCSAKSTAYALHGSQAGYKVDSWRFNDWDYKRDDMPTYARGLFTMRDQNGTPMVAVRGYDKFFNVNETRDTRWEAIEANTTGPYEITLKENGCIIFVAGLPDDTLVVCSKHSTGGGGGGGGGGDERLSHSSAGEARLEAQLARLGRTKQELARELFRRNATAVAELCDDSFEEHILAYGPDRAGLYLHGINLNLPRFRTYPSALVQDFAQRWGFRQTDVTVLDDVAAVRAFLESVAETGAYENRDVEGFVVRCRMSPAPGVQPYQDWFFKYKFEEPYLLYRQWRECTKTLIAGRVPQYKKHTAITQEYLLYVRRRLAADPTLGPQFNRNHGIIQLRNDFLAFKNLHGADAAHFEDLFGGTAAADVARDVILVPIATLGCGKTTLAVALGHLLGFGHVQNDNITGARRPPRFTKAVLEQLAAHPAVTADRNNALRHERQQIITDVKTARPDAHLVALNFVHDDRDAVRAVTRERVFARGDNHQTIHAASDGNKVAGILEGFLRRFEPCDPSRPPDDGFSAVIDLSPTAGSRANLETLVRELHNLYPSLVPEVPAAEAMDAAVDAAIHNYRPELRHTIPERKARKADAGDGAGAGAAAAQQGAAAKKKPLEYMAVHVAPADVTAQLERTFQGRPPSESQFFQQLQEMRRVQPTFHVTLMHRASARENPALWDRYLKLHTDAVAAAEAASAATNTAANTAEPPEVGRVDVQLERAVFDGRLMALVVRLVETGGGGWTCSNRVSHITVGTRDDSVKPKESNDLLARWLDEGCTAANGIQDVAIEGRPLLPGVVRGVLSR